MKEVETKLIKVSITLTDKGFKQTIDVMNFDLEGANTYQRKIGGFFYKKNLGKITHICSENHRIRYEFVCFDKDAANLSKQVLRKIEAELMQMMQKLEDLSDAFMNKKLDL